MPPDNIMNANICEKLIVPLLQPSLGEADVEFHFNSKNNAKHKPSATSITKKRPDGYIEYTALITPKILGFWT